MTATFMRYPYGAPVEVGRNLVPNPSIEYDTSTYSVSAGAPTLSRSSLVGAFHGTYALRALITTTATNDIQIDYANITVLPNTEYTFSFYSRAGTNPRDVRALLRFYTAAGVQVGSTVLGTAAFNTNTGWTRYTVTATSGATAVRASPVLRVSAPAIGESHYFDGVMLNTGPAALTYFDGSFPSVGTTIYRWLGMDNASVSVAETPGAGDYLTPALSILKPYRVSREARSHARPLLDSAEVRGVLVPAGPRAGQLQALFSTPAAAMDALAWFSGANVFQVVDEAYASMWFVAADGSVEFEYSEQTPGSLTVPFIETSAP